MGNDFSYQRHPGERESGNQIRNCQLLFLFNQSVLAIPNVLNCSHQTFSKSPYLHFATLGTHSFLFVPGHAARCCAHDCLPSGHSPSPLASLEEQIFHWNIKKLGETIDADFDVFKVRCAICEEETTTTTCFVRVARREELKNIARHNRAQLT